MTTYQLTLKQTNYSNKALQGLIVAEGAQMNDVMDSQWSECNDSQDQMGWKNEAVHNNRGGIVAPERCSGRHIDPFYMKGRQPVGPSPGLVEVLVPWRAQAPYNSQRNRSTSWFICNNIAEEFNDVHIQGAMATSEISSSDFVPIVSSIGSLQKFKDSNLAFNNPNEGPNSGDDVKLSKGATLEKAFK